MKNKKEIVVPFNSLNAEAKEDVTAIKMFRRGRGTAELSVIPVIRYGKAEPAYFVLAGGTRKFFVNLIKSQYEKLAEKITQQKLIDARTIRKFPVMHVDGQGNIILRKLTKEEKIKLRTGIGRYRKLLRKGFGGTTKNNSKKRRIKKLKRLINKPK